MANDAAALVARMRVDLNALSVRCARRADRRTRNGVVEDRFTRSNVTTFPVQVTHYFGGQSNFWAKIAAMSVLGTIPIFIAVALLQRFLVRGISMGAVKG